MNVLHKLARSIGTAMIALGMVGALASLGCGPDAPSRPEVEVAFWDEGRAEPAMIVAVRFEAESETLVPLAEGDVLELVHGPQGGTHVEVDADMSGLDASSTRIGARLERPDGTVVAETFRREIYATPGATFRESLVVGVFEATDGPLLLRIRARDASGAQGTTELGVTVR